jgi:hypothetical protein
LNAEEEQPDDKYRMINRIADSYTYFDTLSSQWKFEIDTTPVCPLVNIQGLTELLLSYSRESPYAADIVDKLLTDRRRGRFSMCLCSGITFVCDKKDCGMDTFRVYGTPSYAKAYVRGQPNPTRSRSRYDGVEVDFGNVINICQVLAIFAIFDNRVAKPIKFLMLVTPLKRIPKVGPDRYLPYSLMGYDFPSNGLKVKYHLIEPSAVLRPCILVPDHDRCWNHISAGSRYLKERRYWAITYSTTDRGFGYGLSTDISPDDLPTALPPQVHPALSNAQIDDIFAQARSGTTGDYESDSDDDGIGDSDED